MAKSKLQPYTCEACGASFPKWLGKCTQCGKWNSIVEIAGTKKGRESSSLRLQDIPSQVGIERRSTEIGFLDEILGGGLPPASTLLLAGEPGIGKSTLLFQMFSRAKGRVLYVSAEESAQQVAGRYRSFAESSENEFFVLTESKLSRILEEIESLRPDLVAIDSIQMISTESLDRVRGGAASLRETSEQLVTAAKSLNFILWIVGHVTKEGDIAGPKTLEHLVDTVLLFSSAEDLNIRLLQVQKHRFGKSGELALLEMKTGGLVPREGGETFWIQEHSEDLPGCAYTAIVLGSRVYCVEVQALCSPTHFPSPRRSTTGFDLNRLYLILAVLEKRLKLPFSQMDVYLNVVGGLKVQDPGVDLAVAAALVSAMTDHPVSRNQVFCAEVGLTGELRRVAQLRERAKLCEKIGKRVFVTCEKSQLKSTDFRNLDLIEASQLRTALQNLLS